MSQEFKTVGEWMKAFVAQEVAQVELKLCKDCKHYRRRVLDFNRCAAPQVIRTDPVSGHPRLSYPDIQRDGDLTGYCSTAGDFWEKRPPHWWEFWK